jgi:YVTN family beta-propeller protein
MQHIGDVTFANDQAFVSVGDGTGTTPSEVWVLNADTYKEITTVEPIKQTPDQLVATPNGQTVYAVGRGEIIALDTAAEATSYIQVPGDPEALAVSPDGTTLYVSDGNSSAVYAISTATEKIINTFTVPYTADESASPATYRAMALSPDGTKLYATGTAKVSVVDTATDTVISTIAVGGIPRQIAVSPNGTLIYTSPVVGTSVSVINTATNAVSSVSLGGRAGAIAFTPDGSKAYVVDEADSVAVIDTATGTETGTIATGQDPDAVAFTPDGAEAYVTDGAFGQVSVISTATGTVTSTLTVGTYPTAVAIAP